MMFGNNVDDVCDSVAVKHLAQRKQCHAGHSVMSDALFRIGQTIQEWKRMMT